jgi:isopentenyldiphosphate isomerase
VHCIEEGKMRDEPVDIYDEQGNKTGEVLMKSEAHAKSLWHPVIHLWIYNSKKQILVQKRTPIRKVWPNLWDLSVGGHIASGDTPQYTVVKEAREELGLKVEQEQLKFLGRFKFEGQMPDNWINKIHSWSYSIKLEVDLSKLILEKDEVAEVKWLSLEEIQQDLNDPLKSKIYMPDMIQESKKIEWQISDPENS